MPSTTARGAPDASAFQIADHDGSGLDRTRRVGFDEAVVGVSVEPVAPAGGRQSQEMIAEIREVARDEIPYLSANGGGEFW